MKIQKYISLLDLIFLLSACQQASTPPQVSTPKLPPPQILPFESIEQALSIQMADGTKAPEISNPVQEVYANFPLDYYEPDPIHLYFNVKSKNNLNYSAASFKWVVKPDQFLPGEYDLSSAILQNEINIDFSGGFVSSYWHKEFEVDKTTLQSKLIIEKMIFDNDYARAPANCGKPMGYIQGN